MADKRVIQDSDDSDGDVSDSAASIDPLQDASSAGLRTSKRIGTSDKGEDLGQYNDSQSEKLGASEHRDNGDIMVDFDTFLVSPNRDAQQITASQQAREELWISRSSRDGGGKYWDARMIWKYMDVLTCPFCCRK